MEKMRLEKKRAVVGKKWEIGGKKKIHKTAAESTFRRGNEDPYDSESDPAYHFSYFVQDQLEARIM